MTEPLREEDLVPGKPWTHPETCLEYADWHAFFLGEEPLPHWRNRVVKSIRNSDATPERVREVWKDSCKYYDREGHPFAYPTLGAVSYHGDQRLPVSAAIFLP